MQSKITATIFLLFASFLLVLPQAYCLPQGQSVEAGSATFSQPNSSTLVITAADKTVINFNSFNIGSNESVSFIQPSSTASVLSRVNGGTQSIISGILNANGMLFLVNPAGINFTSTAQVNAGSLVASTLDISTNNFIKGNYLFEHRDGSGYASILNAGTLSANNIALIASSVNNTGIILAKLGTVTLASGDKTTVSFDQRGLIQVEVNSATSAKVIDSNGVSVQDAIANSGTIIACQVYMTVNTALGIFQNAVNQAGVVRATGIRDENGIIELTGNGDIQVSGTLDAGSGTVNIKTPTNISINSKLHTTGNTTIAAGKDINVNADITTTSGNLSLLADNDFDGLGSFLQAQGSTMSTIDSGDITIQASGGLSTLANINSAGDLILQQAGLPVIFNQWPGSTVTTQGSLKINPGVTLTATDTNYNISKDWNNLGNFIPGTSTVRLTGPNAARIFGSNNFFNLIIDTPQKLVAVEPETTQAIINNLTLTGSYGKLLVIDSIIPGEQWNILALGATNISYILLGDCINIRGPPLETLHSSSLGNNSNIDIDPYWTGQGQTSSWSDPNNWDTGATPNQFDTVTFDGVTGTSPNKDSIVDIPFTIANLTIDGYSGTLTLANNLTITGNLTINSGTLNASSDTITVGGNWTLGNGTFNAGTSTVIFTDSSQTSNITGNNTFYNLECETPGKVLDFESGTTTTVSNLLTIEGASANNVVLESSIPGVGNEFSIYINAVSDASGDSQVKYITVNDCIALGPALPIQATAGTITKNNTTNWDNSYTVVQSGNWSDPATWGGSGYPVAGDSATINNPSYTVVVDVASACANLTFSAGAITQSASLTVSGIYNQTGGTFSCSSPSSIPFSAYDFRVTGGLFKRWVSGNGSSGSPYSIYDMYGLQAMNLALGSYYVLNRSIDLSNDGVNNVSVATWNGNLSPVGGFAPISSFTGNFNGAGYTISNLTINLPVTNNVGLFGNVNSSSSIISNLNLTVDNITGLGNVAGLVGLLNSGTIASCSVTVNSGKTVTGSGNNVGGFVGRNFGAIYNCYVAISTGGQVLGTGSGFFIGGFAGQNDNIISNCYAIGTGSVTGANVGGFVGYNHSIGTISSCYVTVSVTGSSNVGGFVGSNDASGPISNCYSTGSVTASGGHAGGFVGINTGGIISNCYATGISSGVGFVGYNPSGTYTNDWYYRSSSDSEPSGVSWTGTIGDFYATGSGTGGQVYLTSTSGTTIYPGWSFGSIWTSNASANPTINTATLDNWIAPSAGSWSNGANWSLGVPTTSSVVVFNSSSTQTCTIDSVSGGAVAGIYIDSNYSGTIIQNTPLNITGGFSQLSGTCTQNATLSVGGNFYLTTETTGTTGTTFTQAASVTVSGIYNQTGGYFSCSSPSTVAFSAYDFRIPTGSGTLYFNRFGGSGAGWGTTIGNPYLIYDVYALQAAEEGLNKYYQLASTSTTSVQPTPGVIDASGTVNWNVLFNTNNLVTAGTTYSTTGSGWTASGTSVAITGTGTAQTAQPAASLTPVVGYTYQISFTVSAITGTAPTYTFGGATAVTLAAGSYTGYVQATSTANLIFTAASSGSTSWTVSSINVQSLTTGFVPIGNGSTTFTGNFNGAGFTISNLAINLPATTYVGLFGYVSSSHSISNLNLTVDNITGLGINGGVGGLVGWLNSGTISNCSVTINSGKTVLATGSQGNTYVGGFVGVNISGNIFNSYVIQSGTVSGTGTGTHAGGFVGANELIISNCYVTETGSVSGSFMIGGFVGENTGSIFNSYTTVSVTGSSNVGGFVGYNTATISNSYATGTSSSKGFVGANSGGTYTNDWYYNARTDSYATKASGVGDFYGTGSGTGGQVYLTSTSGTTIYPGWSFGSIWTSNASANPTINTATLDNWIAPSAGSWSNGANWSLGVPTTSSVVVFNSSSTQTCTIDSVSGALAGIYIDSNYGGSIIQNASLTNTTAVSGGFSQLSGTYTQNATLSVGGNFYLTTETTGTAFTQNASLSITGNYIQFGGTFSASSYGIIVGGNWNASGGAFTANSGTVTFNGTSASNITGSSNTTFNILNLGTTLTSGQSETINIGNSTAGSALTISATTLNIGVAGTTVTVNLGNNGTSNNTVAQTLTVLGNLTINSGATLVSEFTPAHVINVGGNWTNNGTFTAGGSTVNYTTTTGGQTIAGVTYNNLTLSNTSNTDTAGGTLTVNGTLTTTAGGTLDMSTFTLSGVTTATLTNSGTIQTENTSSAPLPTGLTWGGTVKYNATTGLQTVMAGTYSTLTLSNTSGTDSASGAITATTLNISNSGAILNMSNKTLTVSTSLANSGKIQDPKSDSAITAASSMGTFEYTSAQPAIVVFTPNYSVLTLSSGTTYTVNGALALTAPTLNITNALAVLNMSNKTLTVSTTLANSGKIQDPKSDSAITAASSMGTFEYTSAQPAIVVFTPNYSVLTLSSGTTYTVNGALALTAPTLNITSASGILNMADKTLTVSTSLANSGKIQDPKSDSAITAASSMGTFEYTASQPVIVIFTPNYSVLTLSSGTTYTVNGTLALTAPTLNITNSGAILNMSNKALTVSTSLANSGKIQDPKSDSAITAASSMGTFEYTASAPVVVTFSPNYSTLIISGAATYTVSGSALNAATLNLTNALAVLNMSNKTLTVSTTLANSGKIQDPKSDSAITAASSMGTFEYTASAPVVVTFSPNYSTLIISGAATYTVSGSALNAATLNLTNALAVLNMSNKTLTVGTTLANSGDIKDPATASTIAAASSMGTFEYTASAPVVVTFSPNYSTLIISGAATYTVSGSVLNAATLNLTNALGILNMSNKTLTVSTTLANSGKIQDPKSDSAITAASSMGTFEYTASAPVVVTFSPNYSTLIISGAATYTVSGSALNAATLNLTNALAVLNMSNKALTVSTSLANSGDIKDPATASTIAAASSMGTFEYTSAQPAIVVFTPNYSVLTLSSGTTYTVNGALALTAPTLNITSASGILNMADKTLTVSTSLANSGKIQDPKSDSAITAASSMGTFEYTASAPVVVSFSPNYSTLIISGAATYTVSGSVLNAATLNLTNALAVLNMSNKTLTVGTTLANSGKIQDPKSDSAITAASSMGTFEYTASAPVVVTFSPNYSTLIISGAATYTVSGSALNAATLNLTNALAVLNMSNKTLTVSTTLANSGKIQDPKSDSAITAASSMGTFEYTASAPVVVTFSPNYSTLIISGAATYTVSGSALNAATLNLTNALAVLNMSNKTLTVGTTLANSGDIKDPATASTIAAASSMGTFEYTASAPVVVTFSPNYSTLIISGAATYTVSGSVLNAATLNLTNALGILNMSNKTLTVSTTLANSGKIQDPKSDSAITAASSMGTFEYTASAPVVVTFSPNYSTLIISGAATYTVSGSALNAATLNLTNALAVLNMSNKALTVSTSLANSGDIKDPATASTIAAASSMGTFEYTSAQPAIVVFTPNYSVLTLSSGTTYTVNGALALTAPTLNITNALAVLNMSNKTLTVSTTLANSGKIQDPKSDSAITAASSMGTFEYTSAQPAIVVFTPNYSVLTLSSGTTYTVNGALALTAPTLNITNSGAILNMSNKALTVSTSLANSGKIQDPKSDSAITAASSMGTFEYTASAPVVVTFSPNYSTLIISGAATYTVSGSALNAATLNLTNALAVLNMSNKTLTVSTSLANSGKIQDPKSDSAITAASSMGTFEYTASAPVVVTFSPNYSTLIISGAATYTVSGSALNAATLNLTNALGILNMSNKALTVSTTLANSGLIIIGSGTVTLPVGISAGNFRFTALNTIPAVIYNTLTLDAGGTWSNGTGATTVILNGGTLTLSGAMDIDVLTITGGTFNQATNSLNVSGDFSISNGATFNKATGAQALTFDGSATQNFNDNAGQNIGTVVVTGANTNLNMRTNLACDSLTISSGSKVTTGNNTLTIGSGGVTLDTGATLAATGTPTINVAGDWSNSGIFTPGNSTAIFNGLGASVISGSSAFYNLGCATASKTLTFTSGTEQTVTNALTLTGTTANPIVINDTGSGAIPKLTVNSGATQSINNVSITNNDASGGIQLVARGTSTLSGITTNWVLGSSGTTFTWTGLVSTDWNTAGNWDLGIVPSSTDTVIIPSGTPRPTLTGDVTIAKLTVNSGQTMSLGGYNLTLTGNLIINGTLNAGSSTLTVGGNITGSGPGLIGTNPNLNVSGYVGTFNNPLGINISQTLSIHAGGMLDNTSVALSGKSGGYNFRESIPGFIFINGTLENQSGQSAIRGSLIQGTSPLYNSSVVSVPMVAIPMMFGMPAAGGMGMAMMPAIIAAPAAAVMPVVPMPSAVIPATPVMAAPPLQPVLQAEAKASFEGIQGAVVLSRIITPELFAGIIPSALLPERASFSGISGSNILPSASQIRPSFAGAAAQVILPEAALRPSFAGIIPSALLPERASFSGISGSNILPSASQIRPSFAGAAAQVILPEAALRPSFAGIIPSALLPERASFSGISGSNILPSASQIRPSFAGAAAQVILPEAALRPSFAGIIPSALLPERASFSGISGSNILPSASQIRPSFAGAAAQVILPEAALRPSFAGIIPSALLPERASFSGISGSNILPSASQIRPSFAGAAAQVILPEAALRPSFAGIIPSALLPERASFSGISGSNILPSASQIRPSFAGAAAQVILPEAALRPSFAGIIPSALLPERASFSGISGSNILPSASQIRPSFAGAAAQVILPEAALRPSFAGIIPSALLPERASFSGISGSNILPSASQIRPSFAGAAAQVILPEAALRPSFAGIIPSALLPERASFSGISGSNILPSASQIRPSFAGAAAQVILPEAALRPSFAGIIPSALLPERASFSGISGSNILPSASQIRPSFAGAAAQVILPEAAKNLLLRESVGLGNIRLMFPGGGNIIPTYGMGAPLGVEKSIMEPNIKREEKKD